VSVTVIICIRADVCIYVCVCVFGYRKCSLSLSVKEIY